MVFKSIQRGFKGTIRIQRDLKDLKGSRAYPGSKEDLKRSKEI